VESEHQSQSGISKLQKSSGVKVSSQMEEEPSYTPPLTELMSLPFREDEADSSLPRESRKRERHVLAGRDDRKEVRLTKAEFLGGLLSKQVFNTLNAWFYRKYDAAGFKFDSLKCFNIKRYASNEREVDRIFRPSARLFDAKGTTCFAATNGEKRREVAGEVVEPILFC
jgi:hypothetical protein